MAIAPSRLGRFVQEHLDDDGALLRSLRRARLVRLGTGDDELTAVIRGALEEHARIPEAARSFNSPEERVRVFLQPYLTRKGHRWAVPLKSLRPWWMFWA